MSVPPESPALVTNMIGRIEDYANSLDVSNEEDYDKLVQLAHKLDELIIAVDFKIHGG